MTPSRRALSILGALALLSAPGAPHAFAASPAPAWERHLEGSEITRGWQLPSVTRRLADGSTLIVLSRQEGLTVVRYAADGAELSRAAIQPPFEVTRLAADPFGAVAAVGQNVRFDTRDRFWTMTWDGVTGRQLWKAPVVFRTTDEYASSYALTFAPDGDVLVAGAESSDEAARGITIRYARKDGAVRWGPVPFGSPDRRVSPSDIAVDPAGDIVVTGSDLPFSWVDGASGWTLAKFAGDSGAFLWRTEPLGVPFISMVCPGYCFSVYAARAAFDAKGNVIFTVSSYKDRDQEWLTAKYDAATGAKVWGPVELNGADTSWDSPQELAVDAQGDVVITGLMGLPAEPWGDRVVVKYAGDTGTVRWGPVPLSASGLSHEASLALNGFGNVVLVGSTSILNQSNPQDSVTEWNAVGLSGRTGLPVWQRRLSSQPGSWGQSVPTQLTPSQHGTVTVTGSFFDDTHTFARTLALRSSDGNVVWGPIAFDRPFRAVTEPVSTLADSDGNVVEVWADYHPVEYSYRGFIAKRSRATGELLWGPLPFSPAKLSHPIAAALDAHDDVVVTGWASDGQNSDWSTVKYDGATGSVIWGPIPYDGGGAEMPTGLALDPQGNAIVLGQVNPQGLYTWALVKYDASSGNVRWGPVLSQPPILEGSYSESYGRLVSTDADGNAFVAAQVRTGAGYGWGAAKYDGATGDLLWAALSDPSSGGSPADLAVDSNGDLLVTGSAQSQNSNWATVKYSGRNGAILWGPVTKNGDFGAPARIRIDRANDVIVLGRDFHGQELFQWATVKYAGATGQVRWGPTASLPSITFNDVVFLALDPAGNPIVVLPSHNGTDGDWTVSKYSGESGSPVWGPMIYDAGADESPAALAVSGADFVVTGKQRSSTVTVRYTEGLAIETLPNDVDHASCGDGFRLALSARNGAPPYTWSLSAGALPPGLSLGSSGEVAGEPLAEGSFAVTVRVTDAAGASADRPFTIDVSEGGERPRISVTPASICFSGYSLALDRSYSSYDWLPDGQTTPAIAVCPEEPSLYGVAATDARGCIHRASVELAPLPLPARQPIIPPSRRRPPTIPRSR